LPDGVKVVLDGGDLSVVFDGYVSGPSTKDATHLRRQNGRKTACDVHFDGEMLICDTKEKFLSNPGNKQRFIYTLAQSFMYCCCCWARH